MSKLEGSTIMSRMVTVRGRVSMNITASETCAGSISAPASFMR